GLARPMWSPTDAVTGADAIIGTPGYMAPEQARGSPYVDARADIFALGCIIYRCLVGRPPFGGEDVLATLAKTVLAEPIRLEEACPEAPPKLANLVGRMLHKDIGVRPRDGEQAALELAEILVAQEQREGPAEVWHAPTTTTLPSITDAEQRIGSVIAI